MTEPNPAPTQSHRWRWAVLIAAALVSLVAIYAIIQMLHEPMEADWPAQPAPADQAGPPDQPPVGLPTRPEDLDRLTGMPGTTPLEAEPADLPAYPHNADNLMRYRQPSGPLIEEISIWQIRDAESVSVTSYYSEAAQRLGFELLDSHEDDQQQVHRMYFQKDQQTLAIRTRQADAMVRVVIQWRYPATPR